MRNEHLFQFKASEIAEAAKKEAEYHAERAEYWRAELELATDRVQETAGVKIERQPVTGGWRPVVVVDHGDPAAFQRMQEAWSKLNDHEERMERYTVDHRVYGTQGQRLYELSTDDVHYFRLGGDERPE